MDRIISGASFLVVCPGSPLLDPAVKGPGPPGTFGIMLAKAREQAQPQQQTQKPIDYSEEGRKLLARMGVQPGRPTSGYNKLDALWSDPKTGGTIFVGNEQAARVADAHVTHVVNCTDDIPNYKESSPGMSYLKFNVSYWQSCGGSRDFRRKSDSEITEWLESTVFPFVNGALAKGENVLVHCLAGAHRRTDSCDADLDPTAQDYCVDVCTVGPLLSVWGPEVTAAAAVDPPRSGVV